MVRAMHAGWCDGGPLAGQRLATIGMRHRMSVRSMPTVIGDLIQEVLGPGVEDLPVEVLDGEYVWDDGAWRWKEPR